MIHGAAMNRLTRQCITLSKTASAFKDTRFTYLETSYVRDAKLFLRDIELIPIRTSHQLPLVIRESDWATCKFGVPRCTTS
jgi:hypothetical protein